MKNKLKSIKASNFMLFQDISLKFSSGINVISGENSTGKTVLIKTLYSVLKSLDNVAQIKNPSRDKKESVFVEKFQGVFRPDDDIIGRLVGRKQGSNRAEIEIELGNDYIVKLGFGNRQENHMDIETGGLDNLKFDVKPVYMPPKEIISSTENFGSLYREYKIAFEETYADLCYLLEKPLKRGKNTNEQSKVLDKLSDIMNGRVLQKDKKFYLKVDGSGEFEMGLVSEGYRKLSTILYLIQSGSLDKNSVIFWDEPEANMNPKMIWPMVEAIFELSKMGVQIFITTHSYFIQQALNIQAKKRKENCVNFISLYRNDKNEITIEDKNRVEELEHNSIMQEFDAVYDREQELFYGD